VCRRGTSPDTDAMSNLAATLYLQCDLKERGNFKNKCGGKSSLQGENISHTDGDEQSRCDAEGPGDLVQRASSRNKCWRLAAVCWVRASGHADSMTSLAERSARRGIVDAELQNGA